MSGSRGKAQRPSRGGPHKYNEKVGDPYDYYDDEGDDACIRPGAVYGDNDRYGAPASSKHRPRRHSLSDRDEVDEDDDSDTPPPAPKKKGKAPKKAKKRRQQREASDDDDDDDDDDDYHGNSRVLVVRKPSKKSSKKSKPRRRRKQSSDEDSDDSDAQPKRKTKTVEIEEAVDYEEIENHPLEALMVETLEISPGKIKKWCDAGLILQDKDNHTYNFDHALKKGGCGKSEIKRFRDELKRARDAAEGTGVPYAWSRRHKSQNRRGNGRDHGSHVLVSAPSYAPSFEPSMVEDYGASVIEAGYPGWHGSQRHPSYDPMCWGCHGLGDWCGIHP